MKTPTIYIVLPCYNEEQCLDETTRRLTEKLNTLQKKAKISKQSKIVYVDDGSKDQTWSIISRIHADNPKVIGVKLAHNVGHQNALLAGLIYAKEWADAIISMDADLQDKLTVIDGFLNEFENGNEVVYGVRNSRKKDTIFKRATAQFFYKFMKFLGVEIVYNSADCRLMSKRAVEQLANYKEVNLFLRGIVPLIGLKSSTVEYERDKRIAGESKYPLKKMLNFAWDGITSFSVKPIRFVLTIGIALSIFSFLAIIYALVMWAIGHTVSGWTFIICSIWLVAGVQMLSLGIIGEYIGKTYSETKQRPRYFIETVIGEEKNA